MKKQSLLLIIACIFSISWNIASAEKTFKGGHVACVSEELLKQMIAASIEEDRRSQDYLLEHGCLVPKAGIPIAVLEKTWSGVKVRAFVGNDAYILWTFRDNIVE